MIFSANRRPLRRIMCYHISASVPLIPKFATEGAARSSELRNRDTSKNLQVWRAVPRYNRPVTTTSGFVLLEPATNLRRLAIEGAAPVQACAAAVVIPVGRA